MRIANIKLEHISNGILVPDAKLMKGIAAELLERRRSQGDAPQKCEGCGKRARTVDADGNALCRACLKSLNAEAVKSTKIGDLLPLNPPPMVSGSPTGEEGQPATPHNAASTSWPMMEGEH